MDFIIGVLGVTALICIGIYGTLAYQNWKAGKAEPWKLF